MPKVNGKAKGNRSELEVVKLLSESFKELFSRSPNSGGFGTSHARFLTKQVDTLFSGDVLCPTNFIFSIENKSGYDIDISKIFTLKKVKSKLYEFIEQSSKDAVRVGLLPLVIYKRDYCDRIAILPYHNHSREKELKKLLKDKIKTYMIFHHKVEDSPWSKWVIITFEELLEKAQKSFFFDEKEN